MIGAIAGDIIGSAYERDPVKSEDFDLFLPSSRFTDDTVLTVAVADSLLGGGSYEECLRRYASAHPDAGFSRATLSRLLSMPGGRTDSLGNGAAMRVSPMGWAFGDEGTIMREAEKSALPTHGHPLGVLWAQAVALGVFWARSGIGNGEIRKRVEELTGVSLNRTIEEIRPGYHFDATAPGSVPESFIAFLEASSYEEAVRLAVSLGGDADTQACIAGALAEASFGEVPGHIVCRARDSLPLQFLEVLDDFEDRYS
ncbi:MAG TPA: ADP-ribosylglycohydrolase family protein [Synergistetes bacterium]|nr:ADP-ribosylglycohydrolase family protein [Synergistota bacterium]